MLRGVVFAVALFQFELILIGSIKIDLSVSPFLSETTDASALNGELSYGEPRLVVGATFDSEEEKSLVIETSMLCLAINGRRCHCFEGQRIDSVLPVLHEDCLPRHPSDGRRAGTEAQRWLSVQLVLAEGKNIVRSGPSMAFSSPGVPLVGSSSPGHSKLLTLVATLVLDDLPRFIVLMRSLQQIGWAPSGASGRGDAVSHIDRLLVIVPDAEAEYLRIALTGFAKLLGFPVEVLAESNLLPPGEYYPYAAQMAIKLLVARVVTTPFYITLDADVVLLRDFNVSELLKPISSSESKEILGGVYIPESRYAFHPDWWAGSEAFLGLPLSRNHGTQGFGVTPAVLSTFGALQVVERVREALGSSEDFVLRWLMSFGRDALWSEYTLYRVVLDDMQVRFYGHSVNSHVYLYAMIRLEI
jgi:hypothetical protein